MAAEATDDAEDAEATDDNDGSSLAVQHTGVMVAFFLKAAAAQALALPDGEAPDELHVTLAFLGDSSALTPDTLAALRMTVQRFATRAQPLVGTVSGIGRFNPSPSSEGKVPVIALLNIPGIQRWRARLADALERAGAPADTTFEYTPHITLAYVDAADPLPVLQLKPVRLQLETVTLAVGDRRDTFTLGSHQKPATEGRAQMIERAEQVEKANSENSENANNGAFVYDEAGELIPAYSPVCTFCAYWGPLDGRACAAYPARGSIPVAIWTGANLHMVPFGGEKRGKDGKPIVFEPVKGVQLPANLKQALAARAQAAQAVKAGKSPR